MGKVFVIGNGFDLDMGSARDAQTLPTVLRKASVTLFKLYQKSKRRILANQIWCSNLSGN